MFRTVKVLSYDSETFAVRPSVFRLEPMPTV